MHAARSTAGFPVYRIMNLYQDIFFRSLDMLRGRRTISRLHFLRRSQYWSPERLRQWQLDCLNRLLHQARANSGFYARRLSGVTLPLTHIDGIEQIPVLEKSEIRANMDALRCANIPKSRFVMSRTGGSTGEPTFYYWDKRGMDWNRASVYRSAEWAGTALGERTVQMSGSHYDYTQGQKLLTRFMYFLQRYKDLPMGSVSEELLESYWREIKAYRPTAIWGYASAIDLLADFVESHHRQDERSFIRALITSSETLKPEQRVRINQVFGDGKVYDHYGSREFYLASECAAHEGYHVHAEVLLIEVVGPDNRAVAAGETGRVLVTDLSNHAFPFIRYEIGDLGVMAPYSPCSCGIGLPRLQSVQGRISDVVVLRDRVLTAPNFATLFSDLPGIKAYQIRQERLDELKVIIVPDSGYSRRFADYVMGAISQMVGTSARVHLVEQDHIEVPESGKRRFVVSDISRDHF